MKKMSSLCSNPNVIRGARIVTVACLLLLFLIGVQGLSTGVKGLGKGALDSFMLAVTNPGLGLIAGILATTLVQSSSVTTSLIVGMVASGVVPLGVAIPMVMGANIGTTVTNSIAALTQMGHRDEFKRAFAAATCHDFFNYLTVIVLLPLEMATGYLTKLSAVVNTWLPSGGLTYKSPFKVLLKTCVSGMKSGIEWLTVNQTATNVLLITLSIATIFVALSLIVRVMKHLVTTSLEKNIDKLLSPGITGSITAITLGALVTISVQSSSITTSVLVPLAGAGLIHLRQVFPVTVGANIGTTVTALLASLAVTGPSFMVARQIAIVHLLFNLSGMILFYFPTVTRTLLISTTEWLAGVAVKSRGWALVYVSVAFYGVPAAIVFLTG